MKDLFLFLSFVTVAFPLGMGLAMFLRWLSRQMPPAKQRTMANAWQLLATWAVPYSLLMAVLKSVQRNPQGLEESLVECALFVSLFSSAWTEARRFRGRC